MVNKNRKLKVYSKHRSNEVKPVPEIRLTGKWIEALGFRIGDAVQIISGEKTLTIKTADHGNS